MAAVGDEDRASSRARRRSIGPRQPSAAQTRSIWRARRGEAERDDLDGQGKGAEPRDMFGGVGDDDHPPGGRGDDLLAQQRAAAALDETQRAVDFVGAVDGQVEFGRIRRGSRAARQRARPGPRSPPRSATPTMASPSRTRSPSRSTKWRAVCPIQARASCRAARAGSPAPPPDAYRPRYSTKPVAPPRPAARPRAMA